MQIQIRLRKGLHRLRTYGRYISVHSMQCLFTMHSDQRLQESRSGIHTIERNIEMTEQDLKKSIYTFVYKAFYVRRVPCSKMITQAESFYRNLLTASLRAYAIELYISFEKKIIEV